MTDLPRPPQRDDALPSASVCRHCEQPTSPGSMHTCNPMFATGETRTPSALLDELEEDIARHFDGMRNPDRDTSDDRRFMLDTLGRLRASVAASLSSGTPAGSAWDMLANAQAFRDDFVPEDEATATLVTYFDIVFASLRSAQERVTELEAVDRATTALLTGTAAELMEATAKISELEAALAVSQARERELTGYARHRKSCREGLRSGYDPQALYGAPCSCGLSALLNRARSVDGGTPA